MTRLALFTALALSLLAAGTDRTDGGARSSRTTRTHQVAR